MQQWAIPDECFNTDNGRLLPWVAECASQVLAEWHKTSAPPVIGFCFSFPVDQTALDNGKIVSWTKVGRSLSWPDLVPGHQPASSGACVVFGTWPVACFPS